MRAPMTSNPRDWLTFIAALVVVAAVMWPALSGSYIFDDYAMFAHNPAIEQFDWSWAAWHTVWAWAQQHIQRPLAMFSYALNYACGSGPWGFKATNLAIHLLNTTLLFALAQRLLLAGWSARDGDDASQHTRRSRWWALAIATAWAMHPLQVSTVMYVVQRMEMLSFTFTLLALLAYWHARRKQVAGQSGAGWLVLCVALIVLGYGAKETAVLVPGYTLLLELTVLHFRAGNRATVRNWKIAYAAGCAAALVLFVFYLLPHYAQAASFSGRDFNAWQRTLTQLRALPMYIGWSVLPLPTHMHFYYDNFAVSTGWLHPATTLSGGLFLLALLGLAASVRKRRPLLALGIGWFFVAHAITSSPLPLELVFEHRNYPALFGIVLALADIVWLLTKKAHPRLPAVMAGIVLVSLGFNTLLRAATWGNPLQLAVTLAHDDPQSPRAGFDLATRYLQMSHSDPQSALYTRAVAEYERTAALPRSSPLAEQALIIMAATSHQPVQQVWWDGFLRKLQTRPIGAEEFTALNTLATRRVSDGLTGISDASLKQAFEIIIQRQPTLATWRVQYADFASLALHDQPLAIEQLDTAVELVHGRPGFVTDMARYLVKGQRYAEALALMAKAQVVRPSLLADPTLLDLKATSNKALSPEAPPAPL